MPLPSLLLVNNEAAFLTKKYLISNSHSSCKCTARLCNKSSRTTGKIFSSPSLSVFFSTTIYWSNDSSCMLLFPFYCVVCQKHYPNAQWSALLSVKITPGSQCRFQVVPVFHLLETITTHYLASCPWNQGSSFIANLLPINHSTERTGRTFFLAFVTQLLAIMNSKLVIS